MAERQSLEDIFGKQDGRKPLGEILDKQDVAVKQKQSGVSPTEAAILGGGALAVGGAGELLFAPIRKAMYQQKINPINKSIEQFEQSTGLKGAYPEDLPGIISGQKAEANIQARIKQGELQIQKNNIDLTRSNLQKQLKDFDNSVLTQSVDDLSKSLIDGYEGLSQGGFTSYGQGLQAAEQALESAGKQLTLNDFNDTVLAKAIADAEAKGVLPEDLSKLKKFSNEIVSKTKGSIVDLNGQSIDVKKPVTLTQLKGNVSSLVKKLPKEAQWRLQENWGKYLEKNSTPEIQQNLKGLNKDYKTFSELRNTIEKSWDKRTGQFNRKTLNRELLGYVKRQESAGTKELFNALKTGNKIISKNEKVINEILKLESKKASRQQILNQINKLNNIDPNVSVAMKQQALQTQLRLQQSKMTISKLLSEKALLESKKPLGLIGRISKAFTGGAAANAGRSVLRAATGIIPGVATGVVEGKILERGLGGDPYDALGNFIDIKFGGKKKKEEALKKMKEKADAYIKSRML